MGTSASSNGPYGRVPFDPPWLDDVEIPESDDVSPSDGEEDDEPRPPDDQTEPPPQSSFAPLRRFKSARHELGNYARSGDRESLQKAIGHYSRTGMGGARNAANRMRFSTRSATALFGFLQATREGTDPAINEWVTLLASRNPSAGEVIEEIITRVAPNGGSIDETSCRISMAQAMESLIKKHPSVDLLNLDDDNIWALIGYFLGYEAFSRLCLDIGQVFEASKLSPRDRVARMNEMHEYLEAEIYVQLEKLRESDLNANSNQLQIILQSALRNTFLVYEGTL